MNFHSAKLCNIFETLSNGKEFDVFPLVNKQVLQVQVLSGILIKSEFQKPMESNKTSFSSKLFSLGYPLCTGHNMWNSNGKKHQCPG